MIWSIVTKSEMDGFGTKPTFHIYREAVGKDKIMLAVVDEDDKLDFVNSGDIVLLRTANEHLIDTIRRKDVISTAEDYEKYQLIQDKAALGRFLTMNGVVAPRQYQLEEVVDGRCYFVKSRFGSDSIGITEDNICKSRNDVFDQVDKIKKELGQDAVIEDFIDGKECTVACSQRYGRTFYDYSSFLSCAIQVECDETGGIQTRECKVGFKECCSPLNGEEGMVLEETSRKIFRTLGLKHHARMDFRLDKNGLAYVIDINLIPGLGPIDHFAKCLLLRRNFSYIDAMRVIIDSASR